MPETDSPILKANASPSRTARLMRRLGAWGERVGFARRAALVVGFAALVAGAATYLVISGTSPGAAPNAGLLRTLLFIDFLLLLSLAGIVATRLVRLWAERRRNAAGSRLHARIVGLFTFVTIAPTIVIAVFTVLFFNQGLQAWFSERVQTAVKQSLLVADAYLAEHRGTITADALAMGADLNRGAASLMRNPVLFNNVVNTQAQLRALSEAMVFDHRGQVLARAGLSLLMEFERMPDWALERARTGEVVVLTPEGDDRVRALYRLEAYPDAFLFVGRLIDARVLDHVEKVRLATQEYQRLSAERSGIEITFAFVFIMVSVLLLMAAITFGLSIATRLATPITNLIGAAERVRQGDLDARVPDTAGFDELGRLSRAFNRMTRQIANQRAALMTASEQIDERRRFIEAVLAGVSAGVIGVDPDGRIGLLNPSACRLLSVTEDAAVDHPLTSIVPEFADLVGNARLTSIGAQAQINLTRDGRVRNLAVSATQERGDDGKAGLIVTFDDITDLVSAQRQAAWADIARRIAHEIKNPLTPIQLSAERLRRKYGREITSDPEVFQRCTDTIIRQVGDIGRMVDEFSAFARMPAPVFAIERLQELAQQGVFAQQMADTGVSFRLEAPEEPIMVRCDRRQIAQVFTNLLKNAHEAIDGRREADPDAPPGRVVVRISADEDRATIEIIDNGRGLPQEDRHRLTEPYVTTRVKGTGLGLAIVKKIVEEHAGQISLDDAAGGGAVVRFSLPRAQAEQAGSPADVANDKVA